jgi:hypothetical protein
MTNELATIHLHVDDDPYARVRKEALDDANLSWKSKGILSYLLGKPNNWRVRTRDLENRSSDGATAVRSAIRELEKYGYMKRETVREKGKFTGIIWHVSDRPIFIQNPPHEGFPHTVNTGTENPPLSKNEDTKKELSKGTVEKRPKRRTPKEADPRHEEFKTLWSENYERSFGRPALYSKKDDEAIRDMIRTTTLTPKELTDFAARAWKRKGPKFWNCERARAVDFFAKYYTRIIGELETDQPAPRDDDHEARYGMPRGTIPLSRRPPPGEDESGNPISDDEYNDRFPLTLYDQDK